MPFCSYILTLSILKSQFYCFQWYTSIRYINNLCNNPDLSIISKTLFVGVILKNSPLCVPLIIYSEMSYLSFNTLEFTGKLLKSNILNTPIYQDCIIILCLRNYCNWRKTLIHAYLNKLELLFWLPNQNALCRNHLLFHLIAGHQYLSFANHWSAEWLSFTAIRYALKIKSWKPSVFLQNITN